MTRTIAAIAAVALIAAACGGGSADTTTTTIPETTTTAAPTTAGAPTTTAAPTTTTTAPTTTVAAQVVAIATTDHGDVLVDDTGMTLYLFLPDDQGPSTCAEGCATTWPPLIGEFTAGEGIDAGLLGSVARGDGTLQVAYNGWPLYRYAGDSEPGDTSGQGLAGNWWVVGTAGEPVM